MWVSRVSGGKRGAGDAELWGLHLAWALHLAFARGSRRGNDKYDQYSYEMKEVYGDEYTSAYNSNATKPPIEVSVWSMLVSPLLCLPSDGQNPTVLFCFCPQDYPMPGGGVKGVRQTQLRRRLRQTYGNAAVGAASRGARNGQF